MNEELSGGLLQRGFLAGLLAEIKEARRQGPQERRVNNLALASLISQGFNFPHLFSTCFLISAYLFKDKEKQMEKENGKKKTGEIILGKAGEKENRQPMESSP